MESRGPESGVATAMDLEGKNGERTTGASDVEMVDIGVARDEASPFSRFAWKRPR